MPPSIDPAITIALGLHARGARIAPHGGSGFSSTFKLSAIRDGDPVYYFIKTGTGKEAEIMFRGEHESLNALNRVIPGFCPRSYAHGVFAEDANRFFLVTDFLDLGTSVADGSSVSLARKLAKLHTTPAPVSDGFDSPMFGFPVTTCCGATPQDNTWNASWADFYAEKRLRSICRAGIKSNGADRELEAAVDKVASSVVPRLIGPQTMQSIQPVLIHGDLWSGNHGRGQVAGQGGSEEIVFDPSAVYGHSEYELGIMHMFGGFGAAFMKEYDRLVPPCEPVAERGDRIALYELYHHLNHWTMFGGGYRSGAMGIMKKLTQKYG
ncbi:fructosamine-3-kinase [Plectosphaerella plurivora]|uniref:protein-ribulosamine 3-kinase n=1 Tax=Plectosphaerella plurivora TaxID=936078 RepID=A0A9P8UPZ3_9PEZI|nr:fructosamine-3-kinase [Plectosphaerella plurivora]